MSKFYSKSLFLLSSIILLSACTSEQGDSQEAVGDVDNNGGTDEVTISFSMWDTLNPDSTSFIQSFNEKYPNINIDLVNIPEDYSQVINTQIIGGTAPDVILSWEVDLLRFAKNNSIITLDEYIEETDEFEMSDFIPAVSQINDISKGTYGLPWSYASEMLYYNKDMFDEAGVDYPTNDWSWDDFKIAAEQLTIVEDGRTVQYGSDSISFPGIWYSLAGTAGDEIIDQNGELSLGDGMRDTLEFQNELVNDLGAVPEPTSSGDVSDLFMAERAAMTMQGSWYVASYGDSEFDWDIAPLPSKERQYNELHTGFFTINSESEHKDEAWKFVEFMMSNEGQPLISEMFSNPSARESIAKNEDYKVQGENGPENWGVFNINADNGGFGYVMFPPTITNNLVNQFNAVLLGMTEIDDVMENDIPAAEEAIENFN